MKPSTDKRLLQSDIPNIAFRPHADAEALIEIVTIEGLDARKTLLDHDPEKPHRVDFHLLVMFEKGHGSHFLDFNYSHFNDHSLIFIRKNQIHAFDLSSSPRGKIVLFSAHFIELIQRYMKIPFFRPTYLNDGDHPVLHLSKSLYQSFSNLLLEINKEIQHGEFKSAIVMHLFVSLLLLIERETSASKHQLTMSKHKKIDDFIDLVEHQFVSTRNAADYADQLHITYKTLNLLSKRAAGKTAKQLIDSYIVLEAKRRLTLEDKPIQLLASELGFDEATNFVKFFKKHTSMTPSHFRKLV